MREYFQSEYLIKLISAAVGTLGFALLFKVRAKHLPLAVLCGMLTYAIYYTVLFFEGSLFLAAFLSTAFTSIFSEFSARICKAPSILFLIPGTIPIVPGGDLYHTMRTLLFEDFSGSFEYLLGALMIGIGIAGGIVMMSVLVSLFVGTKKRFHHETGNI